ncbi:MAG TPA: type VI secretion system tip protein TssI/VgrG [Fimbriiglobus sp.]|nr:type VI secretion system tip protein TssI/VgrG [Fimbriiglobus sp.]
MPRSTQDGRLLAVSTPLGKDALLLERLVGTEALSELFHFHLDLLAERDTTIAFDQLLGQSVTIAVQLPDKSYRYFNGIVNRFSQGEEYPGPFGGPTLIRYAASVVPKFWLLTRKAQSRVFQQVNVPDILRKVLTGLDVDWQIQGTFHPRDYCTQYRETDWAFASRIMEEEGIYYYFKHSDGAHQLVVANTPSSHADVPGATSVIYETVSGGTPSDDRVTAWTKTQEVRSGKYTLWDHCFELPGQHLDATKSIQETVAVGTVNHKMKVGGNDQFELYDYPGVYAQRFDGVAPGGGDRATDVQKIFEDNSRTAEVRMQQEAAPGLAVEGSSGCRQFRAGHKFTLDRHFNGNGAYVLTRVTHMAHVGEYSQGNSVYSNDFTCIPAALPFRPSQITPKARVVGTHTATVVGPAGEEIFTDKYSRVKVQFHWDREGQKDANSSCWCRVATVWAGKQWGMIHIPRIGQEVVVDFLEGDPDQPIIVGSVYNAEQMPPYKLPDERTMSGIKSRSSLKGTETNYNELAFEDKKGEEYIYFHAERDFHRVVENNDHLTVGFDTMAKGDQIIDVFNNQQTTVGAESEGTQPHDGSQLLYVWNNREMIVGNGEAGAKDGSELVSIWNSQVVTIGKGQGQAKDGSQDIEIWKDRTVTLKTGNDKLTISKGNREEELSMGNDKLTIKMGNQTTKLNLGASKTEAMQSIEFKVGQNSIKIDQTGVTIKGMMVKIEGTVQTEVKGLMTQVNGSAMLTCKGGITMIN